MNQSDSDLEIDLPGGKALIVKFLPGWWLIPMFIGALIFWALILKWIWSAVF